MNLVHRVWNFKLDGVDHQVILRQKVFSPYEILHNGEVVYRGKQLLPVYGIYHAFWIDGVQADVWMIPGILFEEHYLRVDGTFIFPENARNKTISKKLTKNLEDQSDWEAIANTLGLEYSPHAKSEYAFRHRMVGYFSKFPVIAGVGSKPMGNVTMPGYFVSIQHYPLDDEKIERIKKSDSLMQFFKNVKTHQANLEITPSFTSIFVPFQGKINEMGKSTTIQDFLAMITPLMYPPHEKCQGVNCKNPFSETLNFVLVNDSPWLMCADCIANIPDVQKKMEEEYKQAPHNLGRGFLYGTGAAVLGAILWALVMIFLDRIAAIFAIAIFLMVMWAMDKAETKRTFFSMLAAGVISIFGVILGAYLGVVGYLLKEREIVISFEELYNLFVWLIKDGELLRESLLFAMLGIVPYIFLALYTQRQQLRTIFSPTVEVFENLHRRP